MIDPLRLIPPISFPAREFSPRRIFGRRAKRTRDPHDLAACHGGFLVAKYIFTALVITARVTFSQSMHEATPSHFHPSPGWSILATIISSSPSPPSPATRGCVGDCIHLVTLFPFYIHKLSGFSRFTLKLVRGRLLIFSPPAAYRSFFHCRAEYGSSLIGSPEQPSASSNHRLAP